ncbi:MAG: hypothetical protein WCG07_00025 [Candidatus Taylorbacteria bacterium]
MFTKKISSVPLTRDELTRFSSTQEEIVARITTCNQDWYAGHVYRMGILREFFYIVLELPYHYHPSEHISKTGSCSPALFSNEDIAIRKVPYRKRFTLFFTDTLRIVTPNTPPEILVFHSHTERIVCSKRIIDIESIKRIVSFT